MKRLFTIAFILFALTASAQTFAPGKRDITILAGEDFVRHEVFHTGTATGPVVDWTGYTFKAQFRPAAGSSTVFANFSTLVAHPTTGEIIMVIHKSTTLSLFGKSGFWDLMVTDPMGLVSYPLAGTVTVGGTITK